MSERQKKIRLFLRSGSDYAIVDGDGLIVPLDKAMRLWEAGRVEDCNIAFNRLVGCDWSIEAVKDFYNNADAADRKGGGR